MTLISGISRAKRFFALFCCLAMLFVAACGGNADVPTPLPTLTLIPPTIVPTETPIGATATLPPRTNPQQLITPAATVSPLAISPVIQQFIDEATTRLTADLLVPANAVQLVELKSAVWTSIDYGCGEERLPGVNDLRIPGYRLVFDVNGTLFAFHTDETDTIVQCKRVNAALGETIPLVDIDPVAQELVLLARRQASQTQAVPLGEVAVTSVRAFTWQNTALGCPLPGQDYPPAVIDGYRIVLDVAGAAISYHTSFDRVVQCEPGNERLPD